MNKNFLTDNSISLYPDSIDKLLFIEDANLSNKEFRDSYENLFSTDINGAVNELYTNEYFTPISAKLINCLFDRLYNLQKYLLEKEDTMIRIEFGDEVSEYVDGKTWFKEK